MTNLGSIKKKNRSFMDQKPIEQGEFMPWSVSKNKLN